MRSGRPPLLQQCGQAVRRWRCPSPVHPAPNRPDNRQVKMPSELHRDEPPHANSPLSKASQDRLKSMVTCEASATRFLRCVRENPSLGVIPPTDTMVDAMQRWLELPDDFRGEIRRDSLRREIRQEFQLLPAHYRKVVVETDDAIRSIEGAAGKIPDIQVPVFARCVQSAYASCRWFDDATMPAAPMEATMTPGQAITALLNLRTWLSRRADELEAATPPLPIIPAARATKAALSQAKPVDVLDTAMAGSGTAELGFYSPSDIAKAMNAVNSAEAIRKALKRLFDEGQLPDKAYMENNNPAKGQAKILYSLPMVRPFLSRFEASEMP